jgi:hypothetical protein
MSGRGIDRCDSYEDQLRSLFISCCSNAVDETLSGKGDLERLCQRLELTEAQTQDLVVHLGSDGVTFDRFKSGLVQLLERLSGSSAAASAMVEEDNAASASSSGAFKRRKRYGRRSTANLSDSEDEQKRPSTTTCHMDAPNGDSGGLFFDLGCSAAAEGGNDVNERCDLESILRGAGVVASRDGHLGKAELRQVCEAVGRERIPDEVRVIIVRNGSELRGGGATPLSPRKEGPLLPFRKKSY